MIEQVWVGGVGCAAITRSVFQSYYIFVSVFFQFTNAFFGSILQIFAYFLLYIMCISSKSETVFWAQNFPDVQLIPNIFKISSLALILQFWKASLATTCLIDGFSYSKSVLTNFL